MTKATTKKTRQSTPHHVSLISYDYRYRTRLGTTNAHCRTEVSHPVPIRLRSCGEGVRDESLIKRKVAADKAATLAHITCYVFFATAGSGRLGGRNLGLG
ncbi:hypothetical protein Zmor_023114 [Zophobas morio]|uniref:Uncharacterized protein n=1 Tax=Zophobas morio TaxID=2755281 RepID=A0AA38HZ49_9CUCU|nr:hypothetical protein Zmor_023114 [Zophobas morio]